MTKCKYCKQKATLSLKIPQTTQTDEERELARKRNEKRRKMGLFSEQSRSGVR